jgi:hypothetical protein
VRRTFTLRIDEDTLKKLHYISDIEKRSVNNLLEYLSEAFIREYEEKSGDVILPSKLKSSNQPTA